MNQRQPLAGRRILVTRSPEQASDLADQLRTLGATPLLIPTIEIAPPTSYCALDAALASLRSYDMVLFTSANAVRAFDQRARSQGIMPNPRSIAVVGPATARATEAIGLKVDLVPPIFTAESLADTIAPNVAGRQTLLVRAEDAPDTLPSSLQLAGANVTLAPAYSNRIPKGSTEALRSLFGSPTQYPDAITFTSASTARNLLLLLESVPLSLPAAVIRASIGPITSKTLCDLDLAPHIEAADPTIPSLVNALASFFHQRDSDTVQQ